MNSRSLYNLGRLILGVSFAGAVGLTVAATRPAAAAIISYDFTGSVTTVTDNTNFALNGTIPLGTAATGSFSYDASVAGTPLDANSTWYPGAPVAFSVNVGGGLLTFAPATFNFFDPSVLVRNDDPSFGDVFAFQAGEKPPTGLVLPAGATTSADFAFVSTLVLEDTSNAVFSSTSIPTTLNLGAFTDAWLNLFGGAPVDSIGVAFPGEIYISLDSLTPQPAPVPEPTTLLLLGSGLLGIAGVTRRRKK